MDKTCVYWIFNPGTKLSKIGITTNIEHRVRTLENQSGCDLLRIATYYTNKSSKIEAFLHCILSKHRARGEWFNLNCYGIGELKELLQGIFGGSDSKTWFFEWWGGISFDAYTTAYELTIPKGQEKQADFHAINNIISDLIG